MCLAIPGKIISIETPQKEALYTEGRTITGKVLMGGITKDVNLELVPEVIIGDYVLIHVGVAISIVDETEAEKTLRFLEQMGDLKELDPDTQFPNGIASRK